MYSSCATAPESINKSVEKYIMNNEPVDYNKGCDNTQSPYYVGEPEQCDLCSSMVPEGCTTQVSTTQHACVSCLNVINQFKPDYPTVFSDQAEFLTAGDVPFPLTDQDEMTPMQSAELLVDEYEEWGEESHYLRTGNLNDLKECIDIIYTAAQYLNQSVGVTAAGKLWDIVHKHNMSKCIDGKLRKLPNGKIDKPEGFDKMSFIPKFEEVLSDEF